MAKMATREAYGKALAELAKENKKILVLDADLSGSTKTGEVKKVAPEQHFNFGIAEGNMMAAAAGMATSGNIVFASTFAMFAAGRAFEQVRNSICYPHLNVKVCATHAGLTVGEDGASHQSVEDVYTEDTLNFQIGKGNVIRKGNSVALIATGIMVEAAMKAADILKENGMDVTVVDMHTIKPIDEELIVELTKDHDLFVTCEEHSVIGGLGSAVAEVLSQKAPKKLAMVGIKDTFGESGTPAALLEKYGLTANDIVKAVEDNK